MEIPMSEIPTRPETRRQGNAPRPARLPAGKPAKPEPAEAKHPDPVDESGDESFPASDSPAHGGGERRR
jgi:hypothetical protein